MNDEELRELLCLKIYLEMKKFKQKTVGMESEQVYESAYRIDSMINLYETLFELSQEMTGPIIKTLIFLPNLLAFLYERWLKMEDSHGEEIRECIKGFIDEQETKLIEKVDIV